MPNLRPVVDYADSAALWARLAWVRVQGLVLAVHEPGAEDRNIHDRKIGQESGPVPVGNLPVQKAVSGRKVHGHKALRF